jgi:ADP-heptose:LPS heptosyltransferase
VTQRLLAQRLLALRALGLGDLLTVVPALRALRRGWPAHRIVLACPRELEPLVRLIGAADSVLPAAGLDAPLRWTGRALDVAVNLHGCGPQSHRRLAGIRPGRLLAFACAAAGHLEGPPWVDEEHDEEHEVRRWCRMLGAHGVPSDPDDLSLARPHQPPPVRGAVVVHPGAAYESRRWPPERYAAVARTLEALASPVVVTGSRGELPRALHVAELAGLPRGRVLAGRTDLAALAALVAAARLVVCGDTGVGHLATAYGTASVVLFGPVPPAAWGPPPDRPQHRVLWSGRRGDPWAGVPDPGLLAITPEQVLAAASDVLDSTSRRARAARWEH